MTSQSLVTEPVPRAKPLDMKPMLLFTILSLVVTGCAHANLSNPMSENCEFNPSLQSKKSADLLKIVEEDQADRSVPFDSIDWSKVTPRDTARRIKVATIFAEGCMKTAADFASAAMVFQHGTTADHYYHAFLWANEAAKRGDNTSRWLTAAGLDRYLVKIGQKQLFGTQFSKDTSGKWCIQPVEVSFPDDRRVEYVKLTLKAEIANVLKGLGATQSPQETKECEPSLKVSPKGTIPGFW